MAPTATYLLVLDKVSSIIRVACTEELPLVSNHLSPVLAMFRQLFQPLKYNVLLSWKYCSVLQYAVHPVLPRTSSRSFAVGRCPLQKIFRHPCVWHPRDMSKPTQTVCADIGFDRVDPSTFQYVSVPCAMIPLDSEYPPEAALMKYLQPMVLLHV